MQLALIPSAGIPDSRYGIPTTPSAPVGKSWLDVLTSAGQAYATYRQTRDVNKLNMELLRQGKPTLTPEQTAAVQPSVTVRHEVDPGVSSSVKLGTVAAVAGAGLLLFMLMKRR